MSGRTWILSTIAAAVTLYTVNMAALAAEAQKALASESVIETIKKRGAIKVGVNTFTPYAMRSKTGDLVGYEIDVANELAKDMGVKLEHLPTQWDGLIPGLLAGNFDVIISGMARTAKRNLTVNFTDAYHNYGLGIVANKNNAANHSMIEEFNRPDYVIAARRGTTGHAAARELLPKAKLNLFDDEATTKQELVNGNANAWIVAIPISTFAVLENPDLLYEPLGPEPISRKGQGMAVRKGDSDALAYFNTWIGEKYASGWLQERTNYWFATIEWRDQVDQ